MERFEEEVKQKTSHIDIKINIPTPYGDLEIDAKNCPEYEVSNVIAQGRKAGSEAQRNHHLQELRSSSLFWLHLMGCVFGAIVVFLSTLTIARVVSTHLQQPQSGISINAK
ncbi:MAG TPA: hypothetical protein V6C63_06850 [Allocoleopsis sp.]